MIPDLSDILAILKSSVLLDWYLKRIDDATIKLPVGMVINHREIMDKLILDNHQETV